MSLLTQAFAVVVSPNGSAIYHILTLFALEAAFFIALGHRWRNGSASNATRLAIAAGLAGAARAALLILAGLGANGLFPAPALLAPLDRGVALLTYILLGWALMFRPGRGWADFLAALAVVGAIIAYAVLAIEWFDTGSTGASYNNTLYDFIWQLGKIAVILISILGLLIFHPLDWGLGFALFLTLCGGAVYHLVEPIPGNFPAPERIAEMAALPLFTLIVYRHALGTPVAAPAPVPPTVPPPQPATAPPPSAVKLTPQAASALANIAVGSDEDEFVQRVSEAVGRTLLADYTLLFAPPIAEDEMNCVSVFDLIREKHLAGFSIPTRQVSAITSAITRGRPARLHWDTHQQELANIAQALCIPQFGPAILAPFAEEGSSQNLGGIVVMSAFSQKEWSNEDHNLLAAIAKPLGEAFVSFNHKSTTTNELLAELDRAMRHAEAAEAESRAAHERADRLAADFEEAREETIRHLQQIDSLTAVIQAEAAGTAAGAMVVSEDQTELQDLYRRSLEELAALNEELATAHDEIERLQKESAAAESTHAETIVALNTQLVEKQTAIDKLRQDVVNIETRYGERFATLNTRLSETQSALDQLREDYEAALTTHGVTLAALQSDRDRAYDELAQAREQLEQLRQQSTRPLNPEAEEVASAALELEQARADIRRYSEDLASAHDQLDEAQSTLSRRMEESNADKAKLEHAQAELRQLTQQLASSQVRLEQASTEIEQLRKELAVAASAGSPSPDMAAVNQQLAEARAEIAALRAQLQAAPSDAPAILRSQSQLLLSLVQDLRQPLSSIVGYTDLLLGESVGIIGALQRNFLERVKASAERMTNTIDDLIRVTAIDAGTLDLQEQDFEIVDVIEDAFTSVGTQFREKGISLRMDIAEDIPAIAADRDAILQIISRLLTNACSASEPNTEVILTARSQTDNSMLVSVRDTGGGIADRDLPRVFTRFYRADRPLIEGLGETGVGLSIIKALAEAQGGRISVESEVGVGSTFTVVLPTNGHQ